MLKRFALRSLPLVGILLVCFAHLILAGRKATEVVVENFPTPHWTTGRTLAAWTHPTASFGRIYDLTFVPESGGATPESTRDTRVGIQLSSAGQTRILIVQKGHPNTSPSLLGVLKGDESLQIVPDKGWIDLGPYPAAGEPLRVQVSGVLPGAYGFLELYKADHPVFSFIRISRPDSPLAKVVRVVPRYRLSRPRSIPASETLARFFFFIGASPVLALSGLLALGLLFAGWNLLASGSLFRAACLLTPGVFVLHAVCLPPLEGADETSHDATIEALLFGKDAPRFMDAYPESVSRFAAAIGHEAVIFRPEAALALQTPEARDRLSQRLARSFEGERETPAPPPEALVQGVDRRSPLFFRPYALAGPLLRRLPILDRLSAYRLLAALSGSLLFVAAILALRRAGLGGELALATAALALVPEVVFVVATCSNYAPAIGAGFLIAALALGSVLSDNGFRGRAAGALLFVSVLSVGLWPDFIFTALAAWTIVAAVTLSRRTSQTRFRVLVFALPFAVAGAAGFALTRLRFGNIGTRLPTQIPHFGDAFAAPILAVAAIPAVLGLAAALCALRLAALTQRGRRRALAGASVVIFALLFSAFLATPFSTISLDARGTFPEYVASHAASFLSNNFAWDQDFLSWKTYWGAFGWLDGFYPDAVYALARWMCVGTLITLPLLLLEFLEVQPRRSALLLAISGAAVSFAAITEIVRFLSPTNTVGRFLLPILPLMALPVLAQIALPDRRRIFANLLRAAVTLHLWTAIALVGARYAVGN